MIESLPENEKKVAGGLKSKNSKKRAEAYGWVIGRIAQGIGSIGLEALAQYVRGRLGLKTLAGDEDE